MSKLRLMTLVGLLAAALTPLYGCGNECAPGTADKDGQCLVAAQGCADGTKLQDGVCLLADAGCGTGTQFVDGVCVPAAETCEGDTKFDAAAGECVPNTDVLCGEGTQVGDDGWCVPNPEACSDVATFDADSGRCIIAAAACGEGTELAADTNECILAESGCGTGLALDGDTGACVPTEEVCDTGTAFDAESGLCLNDACNEGDVLVSGVCMTPAEDIAQTPDLIEGENNDPALGGTAHTLTTPFAGDSAYVFTGAIGEPSDIDGDDAGTIDQDIDVYEFTAEAGGWYQIMIQSTGLEAPAFIVEGPNEYVRYSPVGHAGDAARTIVAPEQGAYTVTVLPSLLLQSDGEVSHIGSAESTYVGTLKTLDAPTPTSVDLSGDSTTFSGDFTQLSDNLFELTGLEEGDVLKLEATNVTGNVEGVVQSWTDAITVGSTTQIADGGIVEIATTGTSALLLVDWISLQGANATFEITAEKSGGQKTITIPPGISETLKVSGGVGDIIVASQNNTSGDDLELTITDLLGDELVSPTDLASGSSEEATIELAGEHTVTFKNTGDANVTATVSAKIKVPFGGFGMLPVGVEKATPPMNVIDDENVQYEIPFSLPPNSVMRFAHTNDDENDVRYAIRDSSDAVVQEEDSNWYDRSGNSITDYDYFYTEAGGDFTFEVIGDSSGEANNLVLTMQYVGSLTNLGDIDDGATVSDSVTTPMARDEFHFYRINTLAEGMMLMEGRTPNQEDLDMYIFEGDFDDTPSSKTTPIDEVFGYEIDDEEEHFVMIHAWAPLPSYEFTATLNPAEPSATDFSSAPALDIPDDDPLGVTDTLTASGCSVIESVSVYVDITHAYTGDAVVDITSPNGTTIELGDGYEASGDEFVGWFPQTYPITGDLSVLENETGNGEWTIHVWDDAGGDLGTLNEWGLALTCK